MTEPQTTQTTITATQRLRQQLSGGKVASLGAPTVPVVTREVPSRAPVAPIPATFDDAFLNSELVGEVEDSGPLNTTSPSSHDVDDLELTALASSPATPPTPPRPGVFTRPMTLATELVQPEQVRSERVSVVPDTKQKDVPDASQPSATISKPAVSASVLSAAERIRAMASVQENTREVKRELASMKTLTRMLEAICARPGSTASVQDRMASLSQLAINTRQIADCVAKIAGDDTERNGYVCAMAMEAAVGLACRSWESGREVDWPTLLEASVNTKEIMEAAVDLAYADSRRYEPVEHAAAATDRLAVSMHSAFWQLIELGESVRSITPVTAAQIIRDCANYLQSRDKFVLDPTMQVSWMQGSIHRMTNLICAEMRHRFGDNGLEPTSEDIATVLSAARSGFEGVENYAQNIIEKSRPVHSPRPDAF